MQFTTPQKARGLTFYRKKNFLPAL